MDSTITTGVSRRSFMRILGAASAAATSFPALAAVQQATPAAPAGGRRGMGGMSDMGDRRQLPPDTVIISSNENPLGPAQSALTAICSTAAMGGRYHGEETMKTLKAFNEIFGLKNPAPRSAGILGTVPWIGWSFGPGADVQHRPGQAIGLWRPEL